MTAEIRSAIFARWVGAVAILRRAYSSLRAVARSNSWIGVIIVFVSRSRSARRTFCLALSCMTPSRSKLQYAASWVWFWLRESSVTLV